MKTFRYLLWAAILILGAFLAWSTLDWTFRDISSAPSRKVGADIGGPFTAQLVDGSRFTQADMMGRPHMVFFGFTHCPEVCPTTLYEAGQWLNELGDDGNKIDVYFVTVDPQRDTPQVLGQYLTAFDKRINGITGSPEQIATLVKAWRVYSERVETDDDYTMNHTATTYLMTAKGQFFGTIAYGESAATAVQKLKRLVRHK
ncbi:MAG: SCO family protein [Hyphomicrobiales bacterium]|nr:MAG: SCO family protein [Hyphomicrobiales bacterium]